MTAPLLPPADAADVIAIGPELSLAASIVLLLVLRCMTTRANRWAGPIVLTVALIATVTTAMQMMQSLPGYMLSYGISWEAVRIGPLFGGLIAHSPLTATLRMLILLTLGLTAVLCSLTGLPRPNQSIDFWTLLLGATVGAMLTVTADHVLTMFVGVEMMSVPGYVLAAYFKGRREATEAALKYVVYGAGASGVMLYGLSLLTGLSGTTDLVPLLASTSTRLDPAMLLSDSEAMLSLIGLLMVICGLAFKLSAAPFHFWCPDVFTAAPAEVAGYLSVAPKIATVGLVARMVLGSPPQLAAVLGLTLAFFSIASVIHGNLAAFSQKNAKRLMAYSTIAHAGYLLLGLAAIGFVAEDRRGEALTSTLYYVFAYLFMNLAVFGGIAILRDATGGETLDHLRRLVHRNDAATAVVASIAIGCFSLVGLPPFAGFLGKLRVFVSAFEAAQTVPVVAVALAAAMIMSIVSLGYYLKLIAPMVFGPAAEPSPKVHVGVEPAMFVALLAAMLFLLLIPFAGPLLELCQMVAETTIERM